MNLRTQQLKNLNYFLLSQASHENESIFQATFMGPQCISSQFREL